MVRPQDIQRGQPSLKAYREVNYCPSRESRRIGCLAKMIAAMLEMNAGGALLHSTPASAFHHVSLGCYERRSVAKTLGFTDRSRLAGII